MFAPQLKMHGHAIRETPVELLSCSQAGFLAVDSLFVGQQQTANSKQQTANSKQQTANMVERLMEVLVVRESRKSKLECRGPSSSGEQACHAA